MPLAERVQIIEAIKYVDEVVIVDTLDKEKMWKRKKFNVVFIGDDWKGTERWNATEENLKKCNVEVVYLPYTTGTTSTLLREKLNGL